MWSFDEQKYIVHVVFKGINAGHRLKLMRMNTTPSPNRTDQSSNKANYQGKRWMLISSIISNTVSVHSNKVANNCYEISLILERNNCHCRQDKTVWTCEFLDKLRAAKLYFIVTEWRFCKWYTETYCDVMLTLKLNCINIFVMLLVPIDH